MKLVNVSDRVSALFPLGDQKAAEDTLYIVEVEPDQLVMALLEPDVILRADGVNLPEGADLFIEASSIQQVGRKKSKKSKVKVSIKIKGGGDVNVDVDVQG